MNEFIIREANINDAETIVNFINGLAIFERLENECVVNEQLILKNVFENRFANVLIGEVNGFPVCFALYFFNFSTFLGKPGIYLEDLFVLPEHRSQGYGTKMLKYLAKIALEKDCGRVEWSVLNWNQPAIKVYKGIGAKPMDEWTIYRLTGEELSNFANC